MKYYLFNPKSAKTRSEAEAMLGGSVALIDALELDYRAFFNGLNPEDEIILIGGDGTINYLINAIDTDTITNNIYLLGAGTGNDFLRDINCPVDVPVLLNDYLKNLPRVYVNGIERKFINGIGYGIDGYCCEVADNIRRTSPGKKINYSAIAIKGILFHFKPRRATVSVDGVTVTRDNVWIAATMKGRYYGGGLMITPSQNRLSTQREVSVVTYASGWNLRALAHFPSVSKGTHVKAANLVTIRTGHDITVTFDKPCALQIDGDTVLNVSEYRVSTGNSSTYTD